MQEKKVKAIFHGHVGRKPIKLGALLERGLSFDKLVNTIHGGISEGGIYFLCGYNDTDSYKVLMESSGGKYSRVLTNNKSACYVPEKDILIVNCQEPATRHTNRNGEKMRADIVFAGLPIGVSFPYNKCNFRDTCREAREKYNARIVVVHPFSMNAGAGLYSPESLNF